MESSYKNRLFDVIVIGGGISGLGAALECASRGFETLVLERDRICSATSNQSLRIIHGGFRYLQSGDLPRIIQSIRDQTQILREAPSLVKLLPCVMPLKRFGLRSRGPVELAANLYNLLCEQVVGHRSRASVISTEFIQKHVQLLRGYAPHGALLWYDARLRDPQKFAALIRHKIDREGGEIAEGISASRVRREGKVFIVSCSDGDESGEVCARVVVNAAGPWYSGIDLDGTSRRKGPAAWCRAFNVVLNRKLQERFAVGAVSPEGRLFFAVPRAEVTSIGTGYLPIIDAKNPLAVSGEELDAFLEDFNRTFPSARIERGDVRDCEVGLLPAAAVSAIPGKIKLYGRAKIWDYDGFIDVIGTKYTTFHSLGTKVLRTALKHLR